MRTTRKEWVILLCVGLLASPAIAEEDETIEFLFVQTAENLAVDPATLTFRLVNVSPQTLYFSNRPYRVAGHLKMDDYLEEWSDAAGPDNLSADPPNATLSVYGPGQTESTLVVVEITDPVVEGDDLTYSYKLIDGTMPELGGHAALFIDKIGPGGGVGLGYHGVGVGRRGPGV